MANETGKELLVYELTQKLWHLDFKFKYLFIFEHLYKIYYFP